MGVKTISVKQKSYKIDLSGFEDEAIGLRITKRRVHKIDNTASC